MKNHSCLPGSTKGLRSICGTAIDINDIDFAPSQNQLLYMDKVYSKGEGSGCPLVFELTTTPSTFQTQLLMSPFFNNNENLCEEIFGSDCYHNKHSCEMESQYCNSNCMCCCNCNCLSPATSCQLSEDAVFNIMKSYVKVSAFNLADPYNLDNNQVTIDGKAVDSLNYYGGSYEAVITSKLPEIIKHPCAENNLPTKAFFLICHAGPWVYQAEFVLEGTVTTGGNTCCFRAIFTTLSESPVCASIPVSNIDVPKISIPCVSGGAYPRLFFSFGGNMSLLNPEIHVISDNDTLSIILNSCIVAEPTVNVEVIKKALFCINGCEALFPCEGTESAIESEEDDDEPLTGPICKCGTSSNTNNVDSLEDSNCGNTIAFGTNSCCSSCCKGY